MDQIQVFAGGSKLLAVLLNLLNGRLAEVRVDVHRRPGGAGSGAHLAGQLLLIDIAFNVNVKLFVAAPAKLFAQFFPKKVGVWENPD